MIEASAVRAQDEGMAFGAPEGADGEGSRNLTRGLGALMLLALGAAAATLRRRFI
ncbi:MAG TPA: hypothetical protein VHG70_05715 [Nocardioidaceae bacterium]|nr:hypothetical protein [Nocardioidaceae bacterium]